MEIGLFRSSTLPQAIVEVTEVVEIGLKRQANPPKVILEVVDIGQVLPDTIPLIMLCNWSSGHGICPNCEVVMLQHRTVTPPHLGYINIIKNFISIPHAPPDSTAFIDYSFHSSILPPPCHQTFIIVSLYMFVTAPLLLYR